MERSEERGTRREHAQQNEDGEDKTRMTQPVARCTPALRQPVFAAVGPPPWTPTPREVRAILADGSECPEGKESEEISIDAAPKDPKGKEKKGGAPGKPKVAKKILAKTGDAAFQWEIMKAARVADAVSIGCRSCNRSALLPCGCACPSWQMLGQRDFV